MVTRSAKFITGETINERTIVAHRERTPTETGRRGRQFKGTHVQAADNWAQAPTYRTSMYLAPRVPLWWWSTSPQCGAFAL